MFTSTLTQKQHNFSDKHSEKDGFQIAVAIVDEDNYNGDYRPQEDYVSISIEMGGWDDT